MTFCMEENLCNKIVIHSADSHENTSDFKLSKNTDSLLKNEAQKLQQLLDIESKGNFSPKLLEAETTLLNFFEKNKNSLNDILKKYGKRAIICAELVSQRPAFKEELSSIFDRDVAIFKMILKNNPYMVNAYNAEQQTILHQAVALEKQDFITTLLDLNANPNSLNADHNSALHIAIINEAPYKIITRLLLAEADPDIENKKGNTPFSIACAKNGHTIKAFEPYGYLFFSSLWPYKNPFLLLKDDLKYLKELAQSPLDSYEWQHAVKALTIFFNHVKKYLSSQDSEVMLTPHHDFVVCHASVVDCARKFKDVFLEDTIQNASGLIKHQQEVKKLLLSYIDLNDYKRLDDILKHCSISSTLQYEILKICIAKHHNSCLIICLNHKFNPNRYHKQISLLHYAIECDNHDAIEYLSECNADLTIFKAPYEISQYDLNTYYIDQFDALQQTPLDYAISLKKKECVKAMVKAIEKRIKLLMERKGSCGLSKHIFEQYQTMRVCQQCITILNMQLQYHEKAIQAMS